jgi:hypothetical protein
MRVVVRSAPLLLVLGFSLAGCHSNNSDQDQDNVTVDPNLPRVTIKIPGMT